MNVAVFHPGTQHSWQTALALQQLGRLEWYATSIFYQPDRFPYRLERIAPAPLARRMNREFRRFSHPGLNPELVRTTGLAEWLERIAARAGWRELARRLDAFGNKRFVAQIEAALRAPERFALWGYSGSSETSFALGKELGRPLILDRTIGDFRVYNARMAELQDRYGEWFLPTERSVPQEHIERDQREFELADVVLVGSEFAAETIRQCAGSAVAAKLKVLPYCFDEALFAQQPRPAKVARDEPVRFLFVGQINPRKGIHLLLEAFDRLPRAAATLTLVGDLRVPRSVFARYADRLTYLPTVARADIPRIMAEHHVLVFPSYFEGSALSLLEALASGLAIIQTPSSGNGVTPETGIMLDRLSVDTVHQALLSAIEDHDQLNAWRAAAPGEAQSYTFGRYRDAIGALLTTMGI